MVTHIHPSQTWLTCRPRLSFVALVSTLSPKPHENPPSTQSPFARLGCYPSRRGIAYRVSGRYPTFIAPTGSCARPKGSYRLRLSLIQQVFAVCRHSLLPDGPSRRYLCESFFTCKDPYPGGSCGALSRFFPQDIGLPGEITRSAFPRISMLQQLQHGGIFEAAVIRLPSSP